MSMTLEMLFTRLANDSSAFWCVTVEFIISTNMGFRVDSKSVRKLTALIALIMR